MKMGCLAVLADCSRDETLRDVGITRAKGLIAALSTDAENLFLILSAKTLNPMLNVSVRVAEEEAESKMRRAGADAVYLPYSMTGYRLAQAIVVALLHGAKGRDHGREDRHQDQQSDHDHTHHGCMVACQAIPGIAPQAALPAHAQVSRAALERLC